MASELDVEQPHPEVSVVWWRVGAKHGARELDVELDVEQPHPVRVSEGYSGNDGAVLHRLVTKVVSSLSSSIDIVQTEVFQNTRDCKSCRICT